SGHPVGGRQGRAGRDPRLADAVGVGGAGGRRMRDKAVIAIATGDPAGIGPEISLKAALDRNVREACNPILVSDARVLERHAQACGIAVDLHAVERVAAAPWAGEVVEVLAGMRPDVRRPGFGAVDAAGGAPSAALAALAIGA